MDEMLHRKLVEESSDIATIIDSDGRITYVSPSVTHTLGHEPEELVGEVGYEYQHPDDRDAVAEAIESIQTNPDETQIIETRFRQADGSWCWIEATLQNRIDDPDINGILVIAEIFPSGSDRSSGIGNLPRSTRRCSRLPRTIFSSSPSNRRTESTCSGSNA